MARYRNRLRLVFVSAVLAATVASAVSAPVSVSSRDKFVSQSAQWLLASYAGDGQGANGNSGQSSGNGPGPKSPVGTSPGDELDQGASGFGFPFLPPRFSGARQSSDPVQGVLVLSREAQSAIEVCRDDSPACVADALDAYADRLEALTARLGPRYHALPTFVRQAARKVRAARSKTEAAAAVKTAIAQVEKTIALLRAEDPDAAGIGAVVGRAVDQTLVVARVKLLRSSDL